MFDWTKIITGRPVHPRCDGCGKRHPPPVEMAQEIAVDLERLTSKLVKVLHEDASGPTLHALALGLLLRAAEAAKDGRQVDVSFQVVAVDEKLRDLLSTHLDTAGGCPPKDAPDAC